MAITVNWTTQVITVNKADMVQVQINPTEIYQLDLDVFRLRLKDLEDDEEGIPWPDTHSHNASVTVGGAILAMVIEIINGYTVTFEDGQYAVNLVGANSNVGDVINVNQVSVRSSNSAGLQDLNSLQAASFGDKVALKISSPYSGTVFPVGTRQYPASTELDAASIADERGYKDILIMDSMTLVEAEWSDGHNFIGDNVSTVMVTIDTAADVTNCEFTNMMVQGVLDGGNVLREAAILDIEYLNGFVHMCALMGTLTLGGSTQSTIMDCYSGIAGGGPSAYPTIDFNGSGNTLALRGYSGGLGITNCTDTDTSMDFDSGRVVFDNTVTGGTFYVRGNCIIEDNSGPGATIVDLTVNKQIDEIPGAFLDETVPGHSITDSVGEFLRQIKWRSK